MKLTTLILSVLLLSSCGKINRILDGTENLPNQIQETNNGLNNTGEKIRKQGQSVAVEIMLNEENRKTLSPLPSNMVAAAKAMGELLTADEAVLFIKNYLIKVNEEAFDQDSVDDDGSSLAAPCQDKKDDSGNVIRSESQCRQEIRDAQIATAQKKFIHNKFADLLMITLVSGFLPENTLNAVIAQEKDQGPYRDVMYAILKMRADFYSDLMLNAGMLNGDKKLDTLGKIEKAIEYAEKLDAVYALEFEKEINIKITGFDQDTNESLSKYLTPKLPSETWKKIKDKAEKEFKADSFSWDPKQNADAAKSYKERYKVLMEKLALKLAQAPQ